MAAKIIDALNVDTKNLDKIMTHECVVARTILFDETCKRLIDDNPNTICLNLGCGLDNRFSRVDNGHITWYNIDLPQSINMRKKFYKETAREHMIAADILNDQFTNKIEATKQIIVVAEGLFMYFSKEQVKNILNNLTNTYDHGYLVVELMKQSMMHENLHETVRHTNAKFGWGNDSGLELIKLDPKLELLEEVSFSTQLKKSTIKSRILGLIIGKKNNRMALFRW